MEAIIQIRVENEDNISFFNLLPNDLIFFQEELERIKNLNISDEYSAVLTFDTSLVKIRRFVRAER